MKLHWLSCPYDVSSYLAGPFLLCHDVVGLGGPYIHRWRVAPYENVLRCLDCNRGAIFKVTS